MDMTLSHKSTIEQHRRAKTTTKTTRATTAETKNRAIFASG
jgi:hypothetical protein